MAGWTLKKASGFIIRNLELLFFKWGRFVSIHPYPVILTCIIITSLCSMGFLKFRSEHKANLLWIPLESEYNTNQNWLDDHFKKNTREEVAVFVSDNVLTPDALRQMLILHNSVGKIEKDGKTFDAICARVPIADIFQTKKRRKREIINETAVYDEYENFWEGEYNEYPEEDEKVVTKVERINFEKYSSQRNRSNAGEDTLDKIPDNIYCDLVNTLNEKCLQTSLLEIWKYREELINSASQQEILDAVNLLVRSPWYGYDVDYSNLLGGIMRNSSGHIVGAKSAQMVWVVEVPDDGRVISSQGSGVALEIADPTTLAWEAELILIAQSSSKDQLKVNVNAARSFGDVSTEAIFFDASLMAGGYIIMFIYTIVMLGKLNSLEVRLFLTVSGIVSIGMGLVIAIGISSLIGYPYTPIHAILPFLCLGIGIDDMFVIAQCWSNMQKDPLNAGLSLPDRMGIAMKHAGVSVTVTSLTDVFAFGVGAVTQMPGLESFSVCTAIGLGAIFLLQVSWFVAWMSLDERRITFGRDGLLPCIVHKDFKPSSCSQSNYGDVVVKKYAKLLSSVIFKFLVIVFTLGILAIGLWGSILIRQKFDPVLLLPSDSYLREWLNVHDELYPDNGWGAEIYTGQFNHSDLYKFEELTNSLEDLKNTKTHLRGVQSWWAKLKKYSEEKTNFTNWKDFANPHDFPLILSDFLFSPLGSNFKSNFKFEDELVCNQAAPSIKASKFKIDYLIFNGPEEHIPARRKVEELVKRSNISGAFSHVQVYAAWETDEIIGFEMWRNIGLAMLCVFIVTLILLANLPICLMVLSIVIITLVDIVGFLHFWDITIDIISCINIVLAIGLCVDYSVHIGHAFMVAKGSRKEKAAEAIATIGPAVFNGGMTTFLALVLLGASTSHVFVTFFKVFVLTVLFGLFHGLVLFPVILSLVGPLDMSDESSSQSVGSTSTDISPASSGASSPQRHSNRVLVMEVDKKSHPLEPTWSRHDEIWHVSNITRPGSDFIY